jgi:hypothetical protein
VSLSRRGSGLVELIASLSLTAVLAVLVGSLLKSSAGRLRDRSERMALEHTLRVAVAALRSGLESLGRDSSGGSDLGAIGSDRVVVRAARASGVACAVAPGAITARLGPGWWSALRQPVAGRDSLLVDAVDSAGRWVALALAAPPHPGVCPDGAPALVLPVAGAPDQSNGLGAGSPIRIFEDVELRLYSSSGAAWLGIRSLGTGEAIQPLSGPFAAGGIALGFVDRTGGVATSPGAVVSFRASLAAVTERAGGVGIARGTPAWRDNVTVAVTVRSPP